MILDLYGDVYSRSVRYADDNGYPETIAREKLANLAHEVLGRTSSLEQSELEHSILCLAFLADGSR
jgi:hypothetical protein